MKRIAHAVIIYTTPDTLRGIADALEKKMLAAKVGQEGPIEWEFSSDGERVGYIIDQDAWHREKHDARDA